MQDLPSVGFSFFGGCIACEASRESVDSSVQRRLCFESSSGVCSTVIRAVFQGSGALVCSLSSAVACTHRHAVRCRLAAIWFQRAATEISRVWRGHVCREAARRLRALRVIGRSMTVIVRLARLHNKRTAARALSLRLTPFAVRRACCRDDDCHDGAKL